MVTIPRLNPKKNGVLVCIDAEKEIYKYVNLSDIIYSGKTSLKEVLEAKDKELEEVKEQNKKLFENQKLLAEAIILLDEKGKIHEKDIDF